MIEEHKGLNAEKIIKLLGLEPLSFEGGYFRRTYLSPEKIGSSQHLCSAIYYLITPESHSRIHKLPSDEIYHFYLGDPVELLLLKNDKKAEIIRLGPDLLSGFVLQSTVAAGVWQGSRLIGHGRFALLGTTMAPAFSGQDFQRPPGLDYLLSNYPGDYHEIISDLY